MVPGALRGAFSCGRCGHHQSDGSACVDCGALWVPAAEAKLVRGRLGPLSGVVRASTGRRALAFFLDLLAPLALVALAVLSATGTVRVPLPAPLLASAAVAVAGVQVVALTTWGRSPGRWLLGQRTVDDLSGTTVRISRIVRPLARASGPQRLLTADLRRGRDPIEPLLSLPGLIAAHPSPLSITTVAAGQGPTVPAPDRGTGSASTGDSPSSVGIVLESGERYEISRSLLIGRSPADPTAGDRPLLAWPDLSRRLAKTHVLLEWSGTGLWATDLGSATGTAVAVAGGGRETLPAGVRTHVAVGSLIMCGGRSIKVVPHS